MNLAAVEIKAFVPARDINASAELYRMLGFEIPFRRHRALRQSRGNA